MCYLCAKKLKTVVVKFYKQFFKIINMLVQLLLLGHYFNMIQTCTFVILTKYCKMTHFLKIIIILFNIIIGFLGKRCFIKSWCMNLEILVLFNFLYVSIIINNYYLFLIFKTLLFSECIIYLWVDIDSIRTIRIWLPERRR